MIGVAATVFPPSREDVGNNHQDRHPVSPPDEIFELITGVNLVRMNDSEILHDL